MSSPEKIEELVEDIKATGIIFEISASAYGKYYSISGQITPRICVWIASLVVSRRSGKVERAITSTMIICYKGTEEARFARDYCRCRFFEDGRFSLHCVGDATDVAIYPQGFDLRMPYNVVACHNVDNTFQQMVLLTGLLKLCKIAQRATT